MNSFGYKDIFQDEFPGVLSLKFLLSPKMRLKYI